jgi:hypothetical protein
MLETEKSIKNSADLKYQQVGQRVKQMTENLAKFLNDNKENIE